MKFFIGVKFYDQLVRIKKSAKGVPQNVMRFLLTGEPFERESIVYVMVVQRYVA